MSFIPKQSKYKKKQKGKKFNKINKPITLQKLNFQKIYLKTIEHGNLTSKQIESTRKVINKIIKRKGIFNINIFPQHPVTKKPLEVRMGKGKGIVNRWICKVKSGTIIYEIEIVNKSLGIEALKLAQLRLPINTKIFLN